MQFQILNSDNQPITMGELDKEAAAFWGVETGEHHVAPKGHHWTENWFQFIGATIAQMPQRKYEWSDIIGKLCGIAAIGETSFPAVLDCIKCYEPFIELCLHWKAQGYIPVSC